MPKSNVRELLALGDIDREEMLRAAFEYYGAGDLQQAERILSTLVALEPKEARAAKLLGSTLLLAGRHREAETVYARAAELDPKDPYTLAALGEIRLKALKIKEAVPVLEKLFALDPAGTHPAANRARELLRSYKEKLGATR